MTGTSMDGIDISLVQTNGLDLRRLNKNYFYKYNNKTKSFLMNILNEDINSSLIDLLKNNHQDEISFIKNAELNNYYGDDLLKRVNNLNKKYQ